MGACERCPRIGEPIGNGLDDVRGKWCGTDGPLDAPLAIVGIAPGTRELVDEEGRGPRPFVGGSGAILRAATSLGGVDLGATFRLNVINCFPLGEGDEPTGEQLVACQSRLRRDLASLTGVRTLLLLGNEPLKTVTGFHGTRNGISHWDGYLIKPADLDAEHRAAIPSTIEWIIATYHPAFIMRTGNRKFPWFRRAVGRAARASRDELSLVTPPRRNSSPGTLVLSPVAAIDLENPKGPIERVGIAWRGPGGTVEAISERMGPRVVALLELALKAKEILIFNANYDIPLLLKAGFSMPTGRITDPMWAASVLDPDAPGYSLNQTFAHFCDGRRWKHEGNPGSAPKEPKQIKAKKKPLPCGKCGTPTPAWVRVEKARWCPSCWAPKWAALKEANEEAQEIYNRQDAANLLPLWDIERRELIATSQWGLWERESRVLPLLIDMHMRGLEIDVAVRERLRTIYTCWAGKAEQKWLAASGGTNPRSPTQLKKLLYETWGLPRQYREVKEGGQRVSKITTEKEAIQALIAFAKRRHRANPEPTLNQAAALMALLHTKKRGKRLSTYIDVADVIHPSYAPGSKDEAEGSAKFQVSASSGRIVAKGNPRTKTPPLQQMPKPMRVMIRARKGYKFVLADYDSQELRIMAAVSCDTNLLAQIAHQDASGGTYSIHTENARTLGVDRTRAKNCFYGWIYGGTWKAIMKSFHDGGFTQVTAAEVKTMISRFALMYPGVTAFHRKKLDEARKWGYISNGWGRRRYFADPEPNFNEIINHEIQSDGAEIAWDNVEPIEMAARRHGGHLVILMHDEFVTEVPEENAESMAHDLVAIMTREFPQVAPGFRCPVEVKIGARWRLRKDAVWKEAASTRSAA